MSEQHPTLPLLLKPYSQQLQDHEASNWIDAFLEQSSALVSKFQRESKVAELDRNLTATGRLAKVKTLALDSFRTLRDAHNARQLIIERHESSAKASANLPSPSSTDQFQKLAAELRGREVRQRLEALNADYRPEQAPLDSDGSAQPSPAEKRFLQLCEQGDTHVYRSVLAGGRLFEDVIGADVRKRGHLIVIGASNPNLREELEVLAEARDRLQRIYVAGRSMLSRAAGVEDPEALEQLADEQPQEQPAELAEV